jgi:hypothetical protein
MGEGIDGRGRRQRRLRGEYSPESSIERPARLGQGFGARAGAGRGGADAAGLIGADGAAAARGGVGDDRHHSRDDRAVDSESDEEFESAHDLWGPLQWQDPSDFLPAGLLTEFSDRAGRMQAVAGQAPDDGVREGRENPDQSRPRRQRRAAGNRAAGNRAAGNRAAGNRNLPPMAPGATGTPAYDVPVAAGDVAVVPGDSRFSLNHIRTSSLLLAATALVLLGAAAHWASNGDDGSSSSSTQRAAPRTAVLGEDGSAGNAGRPGTPSPTKRSTAGEVPPVRKITVVPSSACRRFVETSGRFDSVTVSVQNACQ